MKTSVLRQNLLTAFGIETWAEFTSLCVEANSYYEVKPSWRCIAKGRRRNGRTCIFGESLLENPNVTGAYVIEHFSYLRFVGSQLIFRYRNSAEMVEQLKSFDADGFTDMQEGDTFILEPMTAARSRHYSAVRRAMIKNGTWIVKSRGPNPNMYRRPIHHYRPY